VVWHPEDLPDGRARWLESLRTGQPYEHKARLRRTDGSYRWHLDRGVALRDQEEWVLRWFGTNTDVEEQKPTTAELQRVNAELQQFAYIVSHDLKEPLRNITQLVTFLAEDYQDQLDAQAQEYITRTVAATQRLQQMLNDLLAYTQVGGRDFALGSVDCEALLTTVLEDLQVTIAE
jgi:signal transduction histidine kinase